MSIKTKKEWLVRVTVALVLITIIPALLQAVLGLSLPSFAYTATYMVSALLWLVMMVFIFHVNLLVSGFGHASFRLVISIIPLLALYVVYRTAHEADQKLALQEP